MAEPTRISLVTADDVTVVANMFPADDSGKSAASARPVSYVLAHGFTLSDDTPHVEAIARQLQARGASVLVPTFRGHGSSGGRSTLGDEEVHDLAACVNWLRRHRRDDAIVTLGFSMGASVAVRQAAQAGAPDAVVAVSGPGRWYERGTRSMRLVHLGVETTLGRWVLRRAFGTRVHSGAWRTRPMAPVEAAAHVAVPMLVVHGDSDAYFGLEHGRMLAAAAAGAQLWIEAGMGHAEMSVTEELVARIDTWCRAAISGSGTMVP